MEDMCIRCEEWNPEVEMVYVEALGGYLCQNCIQDDDAKSYGMMNCKECFQWKLKGDFYQEPVGGILIGTVCIDCLRNIFDIKKCSRCKKYKEANRIISVPTPSGQDMVCDDCFDENDKKAISKKEFNKYHILITVLVLIGGFVLLEFVGNVFDSVLALLPPLIWVIIIPVLFLIAGWITKRFF